MKNPYDKIIKYSDLEKQLNDLECVHHECALSQRTSELTSGLGTSGTIGYELRGCYRCDGYDRECPSYVSNKELGGEEK